MYNFLLRKILFALPPETAHAAALIALRFTRPFRQKKFSSPRTVMGLHFENPIGLAAGLDKNGDYINALAALGFGFIEIGTVTPRPQPGNPKPRLFRLEPQEAIINRMGFNNKGVFHLIDRVKKSKFKGVLGINIGKNSDTPLEKAVDDYVFCLEHVYPHASYIAINISSPNTASLRDLQHGELLKNLLRTLKQRQKQLSESHKKYVPIVVKISPDLTQHDIRELAEILLAEKIDGVIATNTTTNHVFEKGGLSGRPLTARSTEVIEELNSVLKKEIPIIGCGGVFTANDVREKLSAGASLVQVYSGLIYRGPGIMKELCR